MPEQIITIIAQLYELYTLQGEKRAFTLNRIGAGHFPWSSSVCRGPEGVLLYSLPLTCGTHKFELRQGAKLLGGSLLIRLRIPKRVTSAATLKPGDIRRGSAESLLFHVE